MTGLGTTSWLILTMDIVREADVVAARQRARRIAELIGFETQDQTRIATAVSEIARNAFEYAHQGQVDFNVHCPEQSPQQFLVTIKDNGPGIRDLDAVLEGRFNSSNGFGVGLSGARRLVEEFRVASAPGKGTAVTIGKAFGRRQAPLTPDAVAAVKAQLAQEQPQDQPLNILAQQNWEAASSLSELGQRQKEIGQLSLELEDTNRGVVALHNELEQKAEELRQASELKTRFLSHMSHEFRTPLNSILALSDILMSRVDGDLSSEQAHQVRLIHRSAESLYELVNDLLDIAKLEAGRIDLRVSTFGVADLFSGLRAVMKPLQRNARVQLIFEEPSPDLPELTSDEGKVVQIIRNFISNALKFTLDGEVRVSALQQAGRLHLTVKDTGVGIAEADRNCIFEEFSQIDSPTQRLVKGTGLGLSLCRRLADVLQGDIILESEVGKGSEFTLSVPVAIACTSTRAEGEQLSEETAPHSSGGSEERAATSAPAAFVPVILIADDDAAFRYALRQMIASGDRSFVIEEVEDGLECLRKARENRPDVIVLDLEMPGRSGFEVLEQLSQDAKLREIPVLISSSADFDSVPHERTSGASVFLSKRELTRQTITAALDRILEGRS